MWPENALNPIWRAFLKIGDRCDNLATGGLDYFPKFLTIERIVLEMWRENALNPIWRYFGKIGDILL
jgi:putative component of membrane protein insertase Oxa1/YidC/SpoIIIJ protein YidD